MRLEFLYKIEKFCFCWSLQNGAVVWGILSSVFYGILFIVTITSNVFMDQQFIMHDIHNESLRYTSFEPTKTPYFWPIAALSAIQLTSAICLSVGAAKNIHKLMMPWILLNILFFFPLLLAVSVVFIITVPIYVPMYIWLCVYSAYRNARKNGTIRNDADSPPAYELPPLTPRGGVK